MTHSIRARAVMLAIALPIFMAACEGNDGSDGADGTAGGVGPQGPAGSSGNNALVVQTPIGDGSAACPNGGTQIDSGADANGNGVLDPGEITDTSYVCSSSTDKNFNRIASFLVCSQIDATCNDDTETAAEIVAASADGTTLIYSDSPLGSVGFVDISDPANPNGLGIVALGGEPTSVTVADGKALVGLNTSPDFDNPSGDLLVVDIATQVVEAAINVGGQPDSIAVSPDGDYLAVVIENERDEDENDGDIDSFPQAPAGFLWVIDISGPVGGWAPIQVDMTGLAAVASGDPEPEYVDINDDNIAVVTLQENNHIVLVDVTNGNIVNDFAAGTVSLTQVDGTEEDPAIISQTETQAGVPREPDGVAWLNNELFATADEGDYLGGSRGFTIFNTAGDIIYTSGNSLDHLAARYGHYPDGRSGNKGNEPENAEYGSYGGDNILVIASERSSLLFVYDVSDPVRPVLKQTLPTGAGPEGVLALTSRNLIIAASEEDSRGDKIRSVLNIYSYTTSDPSYPTIQSIDRADGTPIPWSAMSGLAADATIPGMVYAVEDSFYGSNRIFGIDVTKVPAELNTEITIKDTNDVFAGTATATATPGAPADDPSRIDVFDDLDLAAMINADKTVNIDPEGIAIANAGGFWVASEGNGTVGDAGRPINSNNFVFKTDANGVIESVITLPQALNDAQLRFGFEGVAEYNGSAYIAFQRVWPGDTDARIGVYDVSAGTWTFLFYALEAPASQNGGWVGLSDITSLGNGDFLVVERDNQGGPDAAIKRLYTFNVNGLMDGDSVTKVLVRDLMDDLQSTGGLVAEKIEGSAVTGNGDVYIINDNDGVDDNSGETNLWNLGDIL